jgi:hypothetical protein
MILFLREVMILCPETVADLINQTLGWIRTNAAPGRRRSGSFYARIAHAAFEDILKLTAEGFNYATICEAFETNGLLPEGSKPYSLSRAMRREEIRRQKREKQAGVERFVGNTDKKLSAATPKPEPGKTNLDSKPEEWLRKVTSSTEETALGKLTKHSDGSFDFDWKN